MVGTVNTTGMTCNNTSKKTNLEKKLKEVKDSQGFIGNFWNDVKNATSLGQGSSKCDSMVNKFKKGLVSFDEALKYIEDFEAKQKNATDLIVNIGTGVGTIAAATATTAAGPIGWGLAIAQGAPLGAAIKTSVKALDRATNKIHGDEFDVKEMTKDAVSGATVGATSAVSSGVGAGVKAGKFGLSVANGVKCSTICGAASGAINYATDTIMDENKEFNFGDLAKSSATSALVSGTVGGVVGGGIYAINSAAGTVGQEISKSTSQTILQDSLASSTRKVLSQTGKKAIAAA